ncbi:MAG: flagellar hook-length control protein FliK [Deltaproteobacteria bacterium]|nr:flagellar hook-length control protein FliK [Deltaproteobacteria bacterium]
MTSIPQSAAAVSGSRDILSGAVPCPRASDREAFFALLGEASVQADGRGGNRTDVGNLPPWCQPNGACPDNADRGEPDERSRDAMVENAEERAARRDRRLSGREKSSNDGRMCVPGAPPEPCGTAGIAAGAMPGGRFGRQSRRLVRVLLSSMAAGKPSVALTLDLGEIGEVRFDVRVSGIDVSIVAWSASPAVERMLAATVKELAAHLAAVGLSLHRLDFRDGA